MQIKHFAVVIFTLALTACASVKRTDDATNTTYPNIQAAALNTKPLLDLKNGTWVNFSIEDISPSVSGTNSPNKFEVIGIDGIKNQPFQINIASICDCLGFRKWIVYPVTHIFDPNGTEIAEEQVVTPSLKILKGTFPADGRYKVLVVADDTHDGYQIGSAVGYVGGASFSIPETIHPTGMIQIAWLKQK